MRLRLGHLQQRAKDHLLRHSGLRLPLDPGGLILRQLRGCLGDRGACLRDAGRQGALLPHKSEGDDEEHNERKHVLIKCEFSIPVDLSMCAKLFIMKALQKRPDQRFTIDSLLRDRFLAQAAHN